MKRIFTKGYSLVEMILYVALLALLLIVVIKSMVLITSSYRNIKSTRDIESSAILSMDRITREIKNADGIDTSNSIFGVSPGSLSLTSGTSTVAFTVSNGALMVNVNGGGASPLTLSNVSVSSLVFRQISTTTSKAVKIELQLQSGTSTFFSSYNFYDTAILRGTYQ